MNWNWLKTNWKIGWEKRYIHTRLALPDFAHRAYKERFLGERTRHSSRPLTASLKLEDCAPHIIGCCFVVQCSAWLAAADPVVSSHNSEAKWMIVRYVIAWLPMVVIGIINGVIREQWYGNHLSELRAHQVSTVTGAVLFGPISAMMG